MNNSMRARLTRLTERLADLEDFLSSQNAANDMVQFKAITRERSELLPATERFAEYQSIEADLHTAREWLSDPDMRDMAREEIAHNEAKLLQIEGELQRLMLPKDPNDHRNAIVVLRVDNREELFAPVVWSGIFRRICDPRKLAQHCVPWHRLVRRHQCARRSIGLESRPDLHVHHAQRQCESPLDHH